MATKWTSPRGLLVLSYMCHNRSTDDAHEHERQGSISDGKQREHERQGSISDGKQIKIAFLLLKIIGLKLLR